MSEIKIRIIYDNCRENEDLQEGWGFSALVETGNCKILFDTGNDRNAFFSNMEKMDIDCKEITDVVFSHKHADHIAACEEILSRLQENSRVYLPRGFALKKVPKNLQIHKVRNFVEIEKNVFSIALKGGLFLYEQSLVLNTEKGLVIVTGCAHPGIVTILEAAQERLNKPIHLVLGGFHLFRKNGLYVDDIVRKFQSLGVQKVAPCHCSGETHIQQFQKAYQEHFYKIGTGSILTLH